MLRRWVAPGGELLLAWVLGVAAMSVAMAAQPDHWAQVWPMASGAADKGVTLSAPVMAACACVVTQRRRRARPSDLLSSLPRRAATARYADIARLMAVAVAVALTAHAIPWGAALAHGASGSPVWRYPVLTATTLCGAVIIGYAIGRCLRPWAAPLVAALLTVGVVMFWPRTGVMDFWYVVSIWPQLTVAPAVLVGRIVLVLALATTAALCTSRALYRSWAALMACTCAVMVVSMLGAPTVLREPTGRLCTEGAPEVCLWPDNASYLADVTEQAARVRTAVAGSLPLPTVALLEEGLGTVTSAEVSTVVGSEVSVRMGTAELAASILGAWIDSAPNCPGTVPNSDEAWEARHRWESWVYGRLATTGTGEIGAADLSAADRSLLDDVARRTEAEQVAWASAEAVTAQGCHE